MSRKGKAMDMIVKIVMMLLIGGGIGWLAASVVKIDSPLKLLIGSGILGSFLGVGLVYSMDFGPYGVLGNTIVCILGAGLTIASLQSLGYLGSRVVSAR
jgi:uncharacterized membrane protein YeaQ/YmgE (transglycosylase-associated protein family)